MKISQASEGVGRSSWVFCKAGDAKRTKMAFPPEKSFGKTCGNSEGKSKKSEKSHFSEPPRVEIGYLKWVPVLPEPRKHVFWIERHSNKNYVNQFLSKVFQKNFTPTFRKNLRFFHDF